MDNAMFQDLLQSVRDMKTHMHGAPVSGAREMQIAEADPKLVREATGLSQSEFALLVGVPVKTLQNWEQHRTRPTGPARALLKMLAKNPQTAIQLLAA
ncbi:MAG TPA: helix-turn-helix domain-containing protein [Gallionella sp.]|nr:helix-turn-helix domain-containing protein [Gallionella sp.]